MSLPNASDRKDPIPNMIVVVDATKEEFKTGFDIIIYYFMGKQIREPAVEIDRYIVICYETEREESF